MTFENRFLAHNLGIYGRIFKFKRDIFSFDGSDDRKLLSLKIYIRFRREKGLFAHIVRTNRRIFEIQTAYVQV